MSWCWLLPPRVGGSSAAEHLQKRFAIDIRSAQHDGRRSSVQRQQTRRERCGTNSCLTSNLDPVLKFDSTGKLVKSFGAGMVILRFHRVIGVSS